MGQSRTGSLRAAVPRIGMTACPAAGPAQIDMRHVLYNIAPEADFCCREPEPRGATRWAIR